MSDVIRLAGTALSLCLAAAVAMAFPASAQQYPNKPVRMLLSLAGGGETNARIIAQRVTEFLGVPLVLEANGAAGGAVAVMKAVRAEPDGYTILYSTAQTLLFRPHLAGLRGRRQADQGFRGRA
jgi:tripartite-type tricarboxylate transporter receptor subunit TctC